MNVLIACEESQEVCKAFRKKGHRAFSCDIIPCSGGHPEWHILGDVTAILQGNTSFVLENGEENMIKGCWDIIIGFPPCTYMTTASACRMYHKDKNGNSYLDQDRIKNMIISRDLFMNILNAPVEKICLENPTPMKIACLPEPTQIIQPFEYGHPYTKRTLLWLKGLNPLIPTNIVNPVLGSYVNGDASAYKRKGKDNIFGKSNSKERSKTFHGIAEAMADQWG